MEKDWNDKLLVSLVLNKDKQRRIQHTMPNINYGQESSI